jgi:sarcosine oxidase gamma subunit
VQSPLREPPAAPAEEAPTDSSTPAEARTLLQTYQASPNTAREFEVAAVKLQSVMRGNADRKQSAKLRAARPTSDPSSANEAKVEQVFGCRTS